MLPTKEPRPKSNISKQNFISKTTRIIYSVPASFRWILSILLLLLVFSSCSLLLLKNFTESLQTNSPSQNSCSAFFQEENTLNWKVKNHGKPGNMGTLEIRNINLMKGEWDGDQINETKNNIKTRITGTFNNSTMSLLHPSGVERWIGICKNKKIEGSIKTTYDSQLTFEIQ